MTIQPKRLPMLAALFLYAWCCGLAAQPLRGTAISAPLDAAPIDLPTAIRLALAQPGVRAAAHEVAASDAVLEQAGSYPNPTLEYLREGQRAGTRTTTIVLNQPIELGGKRRARVALAEGSAGLARSELAARRQEVRAHVIAAFYGLQVAGERHGVAQSLLDLARRSVDVAARRVAAGKISPIDETRARLAAADAASAVNGAKGELALARARLGGLIGQPGEAIVLAPSSIEQLPDARPRATLLADDTAAVRRARGQLAAQLAQAEVERAARIPDVTVSVGSQRDDEVGRRQAVVGLSVPLPLFNRNAGNLSAALIRADKARDELAAAQAMAAADLAGAGARYETARAEASLLRQDVLPQAASAYDRTLTGFEFGKFSMLDVLDAQRTLFQARTRYLDALLGAWRAWADIERLAGATTEQTGTTGQEQTP
ncbi:MULTISPECIES: TolC family protein [unclassified Massilia]|uniref:TolC family protein n=1 Tax=unclassified Massilia TaxID=2609279 RepID=UPI00177D3154|nr:MULTISPECIES: TolC family protein [unclassified Massilia]MBD8533357.1 TolC family protein [Massilia sp. CFBP 13647]MBD8676750.1 TolC family protein [Massilia sp. CFBP 13721]